jgi:hypothetical protein
MIILWTYIHTDKEVTETLQIYIPIDPTLKEFLKVPLLQLGFS